MPPEKEFTEKKARAAYNKCKVNPFLPALCFAEQMGFSPRHTTRELVSLVKEGKFEKIQYGNVFLFRPVKDVMSSSPIH